MANVASLLITASGEAAPVLMDEDTTRTSVGELDVSAMIECSEFEVALDTGQEAVQGSNRVTGRRTWRPARFVLRVGKSTPWLFEAARMNKRIDLTLHFHNVNHESGAWEQNLQYRIQQGRITAVRLVQPNALHPETAGLREFVELQVVPNVSEVESITGGTVMVDDWASRGA
jgi:type VI secretion system Hcp family effector